MKKKFIIIAGVSGSGKTTVMGYLKKFPVFEYIRSYVTRPLREGEKPGDRYNFVSKKEFEDMIERGEFLEYAFVHGLYYYGTRKSDILKAWEYGKVPIKEMDIQGIEQVLQSEIGDKVISIFLDIPDNVMIERITSRAKISKEELERRLKSAAIERGKAKKICSKIVDATQNLEKELSEIENFLIDKLGSLNGD